MPFDPVCATHAESRKNPLPAQLRTLGPRQREIAAIVYESAVATPREIQARLSERRSLRVVRTLLDRMVTKGLLKRRRSGRHNEIIYVAAIATESVREAALTKLINERFGGSVTDTAAVIASMTKRTPRIPHTSTAAMRFANEWASKSLRREAEVPSDQR